MTEKTAKIVKNKNKALKLKKPQQQLIESGSDISDSEPTGNAPKIDKKQLKQISTEVTDLLASLKREHGIDDGTTTDAPKGKKNKKEVKNAAKELPVAVKQPKEAKQPKDVKQPKEAKKAKAKNEVSSKKNVTFKVEKPKAKLIKKEPLSVDNDVPGQGVTLEAPKNKKNKNKKRAAEVKSEPVDGPPAKVLKAQKQKPEKKKATGEKAPNAKVKAEKIKAENGDEAHEANETDGEEDTVKKEHHLKNAVPVFVGNLPTNIKRIKLTKMFKKVGKILSIRMRTNKGKSFLRKAQINKVPHLIAFIYFETREAAEAAVALDGEKIGDNVITVNLDSKQKEIKPQNTVVVGNLKYAVTANLLRDAFSCCGAIENIRVAQSEKGCSGVAFICFENSDSCALALKLNGTSILDREIRVEKYKAKKADKSKKEKAPKPVAGEKKKNLKKVAGQKANKPNAQAGDKANKKKKNQEKKSKEFLGLKSNDAKKNLIKKKKKNKLSNEKRLAFKIAPKAQKAAA